MSNQFPMPYVVRFSAYQNRTTFIANFFGKVEEYMFGALFFSVYCVWWIYVYWLLIRNIEVDFIADHVPGVRQFIVGSFAVCLVWGILAHWLEVERAVPRADPSYPLVSTCTYFAEELMPKLAYHMLAFGTCLLYTSPSPRDRQKSRMPSSA